MVRISKETTCLDGVVSRLISIFSPALPAQDMLGKIFRHASGVPKPENWPTRRNRRKKRLWPLK